MEAVREHIDNSVQLMGHDTMEDEDKHYNSAVHHDIQDGHSIQPGHSEHQGQQRRHHRLVSTPRLSFSKSTGMSVPSVEMTLTSGTEEGIKKKDRRLRRSHSRPKRKRCADQSAADQLIQQQSPMKAEEKDGRIRQKASSKTSTIESPEKEVKRSRRREVSGERKRSKRKGDSSGVSISSQQHQENQSGHSLEKPDDSTSQRSSLIVSKKPRRQAGDTEVLSTGNVSKRSKSTTKADAKKSNRAARSSTTAVEVSVDDGNEMRNCSLSSKASLLPNTSSREEFKIVDQQQSRSTTIVSSDQPSKLQSSSSLSQSSVSESSSVLLSIAPRNLRKTNQDQEAIVNERPPSEANKTYVSTSTDCPSLRQSSQEAEHQRHRSTPKSARSSRRPSMASPDIRLPRPVETVVRDLKIREKWSRPINIGMLQEANVVAQWGWHGKKRKGQTESSFAVDDWTGSESVVSLSLDKSHQRDENKKFVEQEELETFETIESDFKSIQMHQWHAARSEFIRDFDFISRLPSGPVLDYEALGPSLPPPVPSPNEETPMCTLFLDLDETLAHTEVMDLTDPITLQIIEAVKNRQEGLSTSEEGSVPMGLRSPLCSARKHLPDLVFASTDSEDSNAIAFVYFRPWVTEFLRMTSHHYEVVCFTASLKTYADIILGALDPDGFIKHRLYREACTQYGETDIFFKDLHGVGRPLERSVVLDNRLISFGLNPDNGVLVPSYYGASTDHDLLALIPFLTALSKESDVREALRSRYCISESLTAYGKSHWRKELDGLLADLNTMGDPFEIMRWKGRHTAERERSRRRRRKREASKQRGLEELSRQRNGKASLKRRSKREEKVVQREDDVVEPQQHDCSDAVVINDSSGAVNANSLRHFVDVRDRLQLQEQRTMKGVARTTICEGSLPKEERPLSSHWRTLSPSPQLQHHHSAQFTSDSGMSTTDHLSSSQHTHPPNSLIHSIPNHTNTINSFHSNTHLPFSPTLSSVLLQRSSSPTTLSQQINQSVFPPSSPPQLPRDHSPLTRSTSPSYQRSTIVYSPRSSPLAPPSPPTAVAHQRHAEPSRASYRAPSRESATVSQPCGNASHQGQQSSFDETNASDTKPSHFRRNIGAPVSCVQSPVVTSHIREPSPISPTLPTSMHHTIHRSPSPIPLLPHCLNDAFNTSRPICPKQQILRSPLAAPSDTTLPQTNIRGTWINWDSSLRQGPTRPLSARPPIVRSSFIPSNPGIGLSRVHLNGCHASPPISSSMRSGHPMDHLPMYSSPLRSPQLNIVSPHHSIDRSLSPPPLGPLPSLSRSFSPSTSPLMLPRSHTPQRANIISTTPIISSSFQPSQSSSPRPSCEHPPNIQQSHRSRQSNIHESPRPHPSTCSKSTSPMTPLSHSMTHTVSPNYSPASNLRPSSPLRYETPTRVSSPYSSNVCCSVSPSQPYTSINSSPSIHPLITTHSPGLMFQESLPHSPVLSPLFTHHLSHHHTPSRNSLSRLNHTVVPPPYSSTTLRHTPFLPQHNSSIRLGIVKARESLPTASSPLYHG